MMNNRFLSIFSILLCPIGIISNLISISICLRKELKKLPTFVFMAILSLINILKLISIGVCVAVLEFSVKKVQEIDETILNVSLFLIFWEYQSAAYLKV